MFSRNFQFHRRDPNSVAPKHWYWAPLNKIVSMYRNTFSLIDGLIGTWVHLNVSRDNFGSDTARLDHGNKTIRRLVLNSGEDKELLWRVIIIIILQLNRWGTVSRTQRCVSLIYWSYLVAKQFFRRRHWTSKTQKKFWVRSSDLRVGCPRQGFLAIASGTRPVQVWFCQSILTWFIYAIYQKIRVKRS